MKRTQPWPEMHLLESQRQNRDKLTGPAHFLQGQTGPDEVQTDTGHPSGEQRPLDPPLLGDSCSSHARLLRDLFPNRTPLPNFIGCSWLWSTWHPCGFHPINLLCNVGHPSYPLGYLLPLRSFPIVPRIYSLILENRSSRTRL